MIQTNLLDWTEMAAQSAEFLKYIAPSVPAAVHFDGETYDPKHDRVRLTKQLQRVYDAMKDGDWITLEALAHKANAETQSVSARVRDLRKDRFGGHIVERRRVAGGLFEYRLVIPNTSQRVP